MSKWDYTCRVCDAALCEIAQLDRCLGNVVSEAHCPHNAQHPGDLAAHRLAEHVNREGTISCPNIECDLFRGHSEPCRGFSGRPYS